MSKNISLLFAVFVFFSPAVAEETEYKEIDVLKWILASLEVSYKSDDSFKVLLEKYNKTIGTSSTYTLKQVDDAFGRLQACRTTHSHLNISIASAEHFMFMRYKAADSGDILWANMPTEYKKHKEKLIKEGREDELKTTHQPVSPPDDNVELWAINGVQAGLKDYTRFTGKKPSVGVSAIISAILFRATSGYTYKEKRDCKIGI